MYFRFLTFFIVFISNGYCQTDNMLFEQAFSVEQELSKLKDYSMKSSNSAIVQKYQKAKYLLAKNNFADLAIALQEVKTLANLQGYTGLPSYSLDLIQNAKLQDNKSNKKFLLDWALKLSPNDSKVLISIATYYKQVGINNSFQYLLTAISKMKIQPSTFIALASSLLIALGTSTLIAIFFLMLIKIIRNSMTIRDYLMTFVPNLNKGVISTLLTFVLLIVPFFFGLIPGLIAWAYVLSKIIRPFYLITMGLVCIFWGAFLPLISTVGCNLASHSNMVFEELNASEFIPNAGKYIKNNLEDKPNDTLSNFYLAQAFRFNRLYDQAKESLERAEENTNGNLKSIVNSNLGVLEFDKGNYSLAKNIFEKAESSGVNNFELFYNLAITHLSLANTKEYEAYFKKAKSMDSQRITAIVLEENSAPKASIVPLPNKILFKNLFKDIENESDKARVENIQSEIFKVLIISANAKHVLILGFILIFFSLSCKKQKINNIRVSDGWFAFPMGKYLASSRSFVGFILISMFFFFIFLTKFPIVFHSFESFNNIGNDIFVLGLVAFLMVHFFSQFVSKSEVASV